MLCGHVHKILLIGDEQQLPSVSPGNVLKDMLLSGIPHICLQTIYRQEEGSGIVALSHDIRMIIMILVFSKIIEIFILQYVLTRMLHNVCRLL